MIAFQKTATHGGLKHAQVPAKGKFELILMIIMMKNMNIMIMMIIFMIIMIMVMIMITLTIMMMNDDDDDFDSYDDALMMNNVLQDTSAWTLEPALMSAMKKN